jgi:hypothetical protein
MSTKMEDFSLESIPSIEIDPEYFKTLTWEQRGRYLIAKFLDSKDFGKRMSTTFFIMSNMSKALQAYIKDPEIRRYITMVESAPRLIATGTALGGLIKTKMNHKSTKNNEMAKLMGYANGSFIKETSIEVTTKMFEAFIDMSDIQQKNAGLVLEQVICDDKDKKDGDDAASLVRVGRHKVIGNIAITDLAEPKNMKFGLDTSIVTDESAIGTTSSAIVKLFYPANEMLMSVEEFKDKVFDTMFDMFISKVDVSKNYLEVTGTKYDIIERKNIEEKIYSVDVPEITNMIRRTLDPAVCGRYSIVFAGEQGTGKTIAMHKIANNFRDRLILWVRPDSINTPSGIRQVFKLIKMCEGCIVVFDDLDSAPFSKKDETTEALLSALDGTNKFSAFIMGSVNDPYKLNETLANRPERIDQVRLVKKPSSNEEIQNILETKARMMGYILGARHKNDSSDGRTYFNINFTSKPFKKLCDKIIANGFNQVHVASIIRDCFSGGTVGDTVTIEDLDRIVNRRIESISCSNMKSYRGRLIEVDSCPSSDEPDGISIQPHKLKGSPAKVNTQELKGNPLKENGRAPFVQGSAVESKKSPFAESEGESISN